MSWDSTSKGFTMVEIIVVAAVLGVLAVVISRFASVAGKDVGTTARSLQSQNDIRRAAMMVEEDFHDMLEVRVALANQIEFIMDSHRMRGPPFGPGYDPNAPTFRIVGGLPVLTGLTRIQDPDDDGDANIFTSAPRWTYGFDLQDDDDDGDPGLLGGPFIDVICRYRQVGRNVIRDFQFNEQGWVDPTLVLSEVPPGGFALEYFGSVDRTLGRNIDFGDNGIPATGDSGEGDGIITASEIDGVTEIFGGNGNDNGVLDTAQERRYIAAVRLVLQQDRDRDDHPDPEFNLRLMLVPPLLPVRLDP